MPKFEQQCVCVSVCLAPGKVYDYIGVETTNLPKEITPIKITHQKPNFFFFNFYK